MRKVKIITDSCADLSAEQLEEVEAFLHAIDGNDDVQNVYVALAG